MRNATFFAAGNTGLDRAYGLRLLRVRGIGPLLKIEVMLYASMYGTSAERESSVEIEELDTADEEIKSGTSSSLGSSVRKGVGRLLAPGETVVDNGVSAGRFVPESFDCCTTSSRFWNVLRAVGDVAESVS
ncbi:hypothetical protein LTR53_018878, partial [Teratosphaeriaceae sp. CCFEE 6253]